MKILPISDKFLDYAINLKAELTKAGVRVEIDERQEKIGKKIREAELSRVPYMLVVGEKEVLENKVSIRRQGKGDAGSVDVQEFINNISSEILERRSTEV